MRAAAAGAAPLQRSALLLVSAICASSGDVCGLHDLKNSQFYVTYFQTRASPRKKVFVLERARNENSLVLLLESTAATRQRFPKYLSSRAASLGAAFYDQASLGVMKLLYFKSEWPE